MAQVPKKTYSRKNCELHDLSEKEKENVDPFDELLSSPLKQDVQFKPLSFWKNKLKKSDQPKNHTKSKFKLYETDTSFSPHQSKKKQERKSGKDRSMKQAKKSALKSSRDDSLRTDSFFKLEKSINSPCLFKGHDKVKTSRAQYDGYVTLRRPFRQMNGNKHVSPIVNDINNCGRDRVYGSVLVERNEMNDSERIHTNESESFLERTYTIGKQEITVCEERTLEIPEVVLCRNSTGYHVSNPVSETRIWNDGWMNDSLERYNIIERNSCLDEFDTVLDNSESFYYEDTWLQTYSVLEQSLNYRTYTINNEATELKGYEENELDLRSDSHQGRDVSDLTNLMCDMTISNETLEESTIVNSSFESSQEKSQLGLQREELPSDDEKERSNGTHGKEDYRYVTKWRPCNTNKRERAVSNVKSVEDDTKLKTLTATKIQPCFEKNEEEEEKLCGFNEKSGSSKSLKSPRCKDETVLDSSRFSMFAPPMFESTRFIDDKEISDVKTNREDRMTVWEETVVPEAEFSVVLKPGKKWQRSMSVLKQIQSGNFTLDMNKVKGKRFETFMQETLEMQNDDFSRSVSGDTLMNKTKRILQGDVDRKREETTSDLYPPPGPVSLTASEISCRESCLLKSVLDAEGEEDKTIVAFDSLDGSKEISGSKKLDATISSRSYMNRTAKVIPTEEAFEKPSLFMSALGLQRDGSCSEGTVIGEKVEESSVISARDFILLQCGQEDVLPFEDYFNEETLKNCKKIGEGVYGEVFMYNSDTVLKIIPIEGEENVNGEPQKKFEEILSEVVIASKLSNLRNGERYRTSGFSEMKKCWCVVGKYPQYLLDLWNEYDEMGNGSENDSPVMFKSDQLYIILELANGGKDLEAFVFNSSEQSLSIFIQAAFSLAAAEKAFEFEHRDLHWGNLLIEHTKEKYTSVVLDGVEYKIPTKGVKVSIIDFTLSRMSHEGCCIFNDLSVDPSLFTSQGDYQFEIYRMMQKELKNDWSLFRPRNNIYWLHYTLDKMLKMVRYKNKNTQVHKKAMKELKILESVILEYNDSSDFVINQRLVSAD